MKHYQLVNEIAGHVELSVTGDENVTVVVAQLGERVVVGTARRAPGDPRNMDVGLDVATRRALEKLTSYLGDKTDSYFNDLNQHNEQRQAARARRETVNKDRLWREQWNVGNPTRLKDRREQGERRYREQQLEKFADSEGGMVLDCGD